MSIPETIGFDKEGVALTGGWRGKGRELIQKLFLAMVIILVALLSFGIGRLASSRGAEGVKIEYDPNLSTAAATAAAVPLITNPSLTPSSSGVVASKSGSKYHYPSCPGAKQIKEANKITFPSAQAAEAAGYTLAANCSPR